MKVLDHGYANLIESWGSDQHIVEAARMSTDKGFLGWGPFDAGPCPRRSVLDDSPCDGYVESLIAPSSKYYAGEKQVKCEDCHGTGRITKPGDEKLLAYLWRNKHATPFEMAGLTVEIQAPILVFRQWHRHRTQSYNEMSGRYTPLPDLNYMPTVERLMVNATKNKQAGTVKGAMLLTEFEAETYRTILKEEYRRQEEFYKDALRSGVPKELARVHIGVGRYSRMRASANLRNWLAFMTLRLDAHAQYEIRVYAEAVATFIAERFPRTWALFREGQP